MIGNILIVDDELGTLKLLEDILTAAGHAVRPFNNSELAWRSIRVAAPELIILDVHMPGMDGFELCQKFQSDAHLKDTPIIFISASYDIKDKIRAFKEGGVDYITKPFQKEEILSRVKTHIALSHTMQKMKGAESALQEMVTKYKSLLDATPDCLLISNRGGQIVLVNKVAEKTFGYTPDELIGQQIELLIPDRYRTKHIVHRQQYCEKPSTRSMGLGLELSAKHKDGHEFPVEISLSHVETEDGLLVTAAVRDITVRKENEMKLQEATYVDWVTSLPNRTYFYETLKRSIHNNQRLNKEFALTNVAQAYKVHLLRISSVSFTVCSHKTKAFKWLI